MNVWISNKDFLTIVVSGYLVRLSAFETFIRSLIVIGMYSPLQLYTISSFYEFFSFSFNHFFATFILQLISCIILLVATVKLNIRKL